MLTTGNDYAQMSDDALGDHIDHLKVKKSQATIDARRTVLNQLYHSLPFGLIYATLEQIEAWFVSLRARGCSRWTLSIYSYHVRSFYLWAHEAGFLPGRNPTAGLERQTAPQSIPDPITEDELAICLTLAEPFRTAVIMASFAGLRRAEIADCQRQHITAETVMIPNGKGAKPGVVPTHPFVWEHIRHRGPGHLVLDRGGRPVRPHWLSVEMRGAFDALGLPDVHLHRLRHRYGTMIQASNGDIRVTQECLRHASISSTQGYTLVTGERRTAAVASLPVPRRDDDPGCGARASL